jgi:tRNA1(Val) A37 N6-methylase TrmN6
MSGRGGTGVAESASTRDAVVVAASVPQESHGARAAAGSGVPAVLLLLFSRFEKAKVRLVGDVVRTREGGSRTEKVSAVRSR